MLTHDHYRPALCTSCSLYRAGYKQAWALNGFEVWHRYDTTGELETFQRIEIRRDGVTLEAIPGGRMEVTRETFAQMATDGAV